jgi:hypothetical protein
LKSILPNFIFLSFPISAVKLSHFVTQENNANGIKWPSLIAENGKKCPVYEEKSLVGLIPA